MSAQVRAGCVRTMLAHVRHRGPDELGYYFDDCVALGTARLSIVDVVGGQQPITDSTGRYWIAFNGEIYNYKELKKALLNEGHVFSTNSDTEVLLSVWIAWGAGGLQRLNGAFAFCIYDRVRHSIVLARDRFGKRPLYYLRSAGGIVFGSEMKAFLAYEPFKFEYDTKQLGSIFSVWTPLDHQSGFVGVSQVPAGSILFADQTSTRITRYASLPADAPTLRVTEGEAAELLYANLSESVRQRLVGDVESAVYLSGGIDSAVIARLMLEHRRVATKSFSVSFAEREFDESDDQRVISSFLGTDHVTEFVTNRNIVDAFPDALRHAEVPVFRTAFVPMYLLSKRVAANGIKVVLTGEGADEVFLGYDLFRETLLRSEWSNLDMVTKKERLATLYPSLSHFSEANSGYLYSFFDRFAAQPTERFFSHSIRFHNSRMSMRLLADKQDGTEALSEFVRDKYQGFDALSPIKKAQILEFETLLGGYLLSSQGDRMSLAHGVENRCPFLDPSVVNLGLSTNLAFDDGYAGKYLLKHAFADKLPERIIKKPKQPYRAPDAAAFLECRPEYLELLRSENELRKVGILDEKFCTAFVEKLLAKPSSAIGQAENQTFLFLLSTTLLHRFFVASPVRNTDDIDALLTTKVDGRVLQ